MALIDDIRNLIGDRNSLIVDLFDAFDKAVKGAQITLYDELVERILNTLDVDAGKIKNTARNRGVLNAIDRLFNDFETGANLDIAKDMVKAVGNIIDFNTHYFTLLSSKAELIPITQKIKTSVNDWLGIGPRGKLNENGYLKTLITDKGIRNQVKNFTVQSVVSQQGYNNLRAGLKDFIKGNPDKLGALQKYYRNYAYDTYSVIDRTAAKEYAEGLGVNEYAIFEGPMRVNSRSFCRPKKGKVFTREEISKFNPSEAKPPNYDPFRDLGGYGCVDHLNWIPYELAIVLRPDLKKQ